MESTLNPLLETERAVLNVSLSQVITSTNELKLDLPPLSDYAISMDGLLRQEIYFGNFHITA